uniref:HDC18327 n=1 Tax=Drosophila melanogaster TaxID=7227 RepID=Q6IIG3_DROME|nr:TPA_inf: HDC18327 [Drosophila melanogaster]
MQDAAAAIAVVEGLISRRKDTGVVKDARMQGCGGRDKPIRGGEACKAFVSFASNLQQKCNGVKGIDTTHSTAQHNHHHRRQQQQQQQQQQHRP